MNKIITLLFVLAFSGVLTAQVSINWIQNTAGVSIAVDNANNVFTVNYVYAQAGDIFVTKRNSNGQFQWEASFDQTDVTKWEKATWVEADNLGNVIVSGTLMSGYSNPVVAASILMKFNSQGTMLWRTVYENSFDGSQTKKILVDSDNNIYVLGTGINGSLGMNLKIKKFAPDGNPVWTYFNTDGIGAPLNFKFTPDNCIVVSARGITGSINGYAKIDKNGNHIWSIAGVNSITTGDAAGDNSGNTYIVNAEYVANPTRSIIKKISPAGTEVWSTFFNIAGMRVEVGTDNMPVISGYPNTGSFGSAFVKLNNSGSVVWSNPDADSTYALLMHAQMMMDSQNNIYLAAGTLTQMAVCKVNSNGSSGWTLAMPGGYAYAMDIGSDNSVYVVGGNTAGTTVRIVQSPVTSTGNNENLSPKEYYLGNNYPNPFNPSTKITFGIKKSGYVTLKVFDVSGKEIKTLINGFYNAGNFSVNFDAADFSSGIYFYRLSSNGFTETRRMILSK